MSAWWSKPSLRPFVILLGLVVSILAVGVVLDFIGGYLWPLVDSVLVLILIVGVIVGAITAIVMRVEAIPPLIVGLIAWLFVTVATRGYILAINAWFDDSVAVTHRAKVLDSRVRRGRDVLVVESWRGAGTLDIEATSKIHKARPTHVDVTVRRGALGLEWVDSVALSPSDAK